MTLLVGQPEKIQQHSDGRCCVCRSRPLSPRPQLSVFLHRSVLCSLGLLQKIALEEPGVHAYPMLPPKGCTSALMSHIIEAPPLLQQENTCSIVCPPATILWITLSWGFTWTSFLLGSLMPLSIGFPWYNFCQKYLHPILVSRSSSVTTQSKMEAYKGRKGKKQVQVQKNQCKYKEEPGFAKMRPMKV